MRERFAQSFKRRREDFHPGHSKEELNYERQEAAHYKKKRMELQGKMEEYINAYSVR
jgi:hypothetical protein